MTEQLYKVRSITDKPTKEGQYFVIMLNPSTNEEFLSTEEFKDGKWTFNNAIVRWLEPYTPSPVSGSLEDAAKKYADSQGVAEGDDYIQLTSSGLRDGLKAAYIAGSSLLYKGELPEDAAIKYCNEIMKKWGNQSPVSEKNFDSEIFDAFLAGASHSFNKESFLTALRDSNPYPEPDSNDKAWNECFKKVVELLNQSK